jgi:hypothetical protein
MTALRTEARRTVPVFQAILAICRTASERDVVLPVAEQLAHHASRPGFRGDRVRWFS